MDSSPQLMSLSSVPWVNSLSLHHEKLIFMPNLQHQSLFCFHDITFVFVVVLNCNKLMLMMHKSLFV